MIYKLSESEPSASRGGRALFPEFYQHSLWVLLALVGAVLSVQLLVRGGHGGDDSWLPMSRALDFLHDTTAVRERLYEFLFFGEKIKFQYPTTSVLFVDLFNAIGISTPSQFNVINACILIAMSLAFALFATVLFGQIQYAGFRVPIGPIAFLISIRYFPNRLAFELGQIQMWIGLFFVLACICILYGRNLVAGMFIGLSAAIKPQFGVYVLLAMWRRNWRFFVGMMAVAIFAFLLATWLYGWRLHLEYLRVLSFLSQHGEYHHLNQSVGGALIRFFYEGPPLDRDALGQPIPAYVASFPPYIATIHVINTLVSIVFLATAFFIRGQGDDKRARLQEFTIAALLFTMASPIAWVHHYNIMLPAYAVALKILLERTSCRLFWIWLPLLLLSYLMTGFSFSPPYGPTLPGIHLNQSLVLLGSWSLLGILLAQVKFRMGAR